MKSTTIAVAVLALFCTSRAGAQTTYPMDAINPSGQSQVPFKCDAVTTRNVPLVFAQFSCRGIFYNNGDLEVFFNGGYKNIEIFSKSGGWTAVGPVSLTNFNEPSPAVCGTTCPDGTIPGTFSFTFSATDGAGVVHTGSISSTWEDRAVAGGERGWYHPFLLTAPLTLNQPVAFLYHCGSDSHDCLRLHSGGK